MEDVDPAVGGEDALGQRLQCIRVGGVDLMGRALRDRGGHRQRTLAVEVGDVDAGAVTGQQAGGGGADARGGAGDDGDLAVEIRSRHARTLRGGRGQRTVSFVTALVLPAVTVTVRIFPLLTSARYLRAMTTLTVDDPPGATA